MADPYKHPDEDALVRLLASTVFGQRLGQEMGTRHPMDPAAKGFGLGGAQIREAASPLRTTLSGEDQASMTDDDYRQRMAMMALSTAGSMFDPVAGGPVKPGSSSAGLGVPRAGRAPGSRTPPGGKYGDLLPARIDRQTKARKRKEPTGPQGGTKPAPGSQLKMSDEMQAALKAIEGSEAIAGTGGEDYEVQLRDDPFEVNASAESGSGGSVEALNRTKAMAAQGQRFVRRGPGGQIIPSNEDGGIGLRPGWSFGIMGSSGFEPL